MMKIMSLIVLLVFWSCGQDKSSSRREPSTNNVAGTIVNNADWEPPIAVPMPSFGIRETVEGVYGSEEFFTHYIDNTHNGATDDDNPNGSLDIPRLTIPNDVPAGSVVKIVGGPYTNENTLFLRESGTQDQPIFIRGDPNSMPVLNRAVSIRGAFIIIEFIDFNYDNGTKNISIRPETATDAPLVHHVTVRGCELHNYNSDFGATGNSSMIGVSNPNNNNDEYVHDIVLWANYIHDNGDATLAERDIHGVGIGANVRDLWMVDNHLHHNSGDAVQIAYYNEPPVNISNNIYIGRNRMHEDQENAIDLKGCHHIIISQNKIYGYSGESQGVAQGYGTGIVIHQADEHAENVLVLYNEISDCTASGITVSHSTNEIFLVGNIIHNNIFAGSDEHSLSSPWYPGVGILVRNTGSAYVFSNLITQTHHGIVSTANNPNLFWAQNNIVTDLNDSVESCHLYIENSDVADTAIIDHNLFYQPETTMSIKLGSSNAIQSIEELPLNAGDNIQSDPLVHVSGDGVYSMGIESPAVDKGTDVTTRMETAFGIILEKDYNGNPLPAGTTWDMGPWDQ
jgi:Right handed beta helix region